jgi:hypothetical protein
VSILFLVNNPISSNNIAIFRRREGYEFMVGPPKVINKKVNDKVLEPYEVNFQSKFYCYLNIMSNIGHGRYRWCFFGKLIYVGILALRYGPPSITLKITGRDSVI